MTPLQKKLLDVLAWYCDFCKNNSLNYYITGGTLLGAVRHKGFIPWDDDVDVCMPRPDYETFLSLTEKLDGKYIVESPYSKSNDYYFSHTKIYDTTTTLIEAARHPIIRGVYVDVFPVDGAGSTVEEGKIYYRRNIDPIKMFHAARITTWRKGRSIEKNILALATHTLPSWVANDKALAKAVDQRCKRKSYDECDVVGNLMSTYRSKSIFRKSMIGNYSWLNFEGLDVHGVEHFESFLTMFYGEWEKIPQESQRITAHDFIEVNLDKPFVNRRL